MNPMTKMTKVRVSSPILKGLVYALVVLGICTLVLSMLLKFTGLKESSLQAMVYVVHGLAMLIGGFASGKRAERRGWYYGGAVGLLYAAIIVLAGFLSHDAGVTLQTLTMVAVSFLSGAVGGIAGVNTSR